MFKLSAEGLGKRFHRQWVFKNLDLELNEGERLLITGSNGSGKSTLMRILAGQLNPTKGTVRLTDDNQDLDPEIWYRYISWSGPYMDLYPDFTLAETIRLHFRFRDALLPRTDIIPGLNLEKHADKPLRNYSSGMLHRVKVGLAIFSQSKVLLLDEATTNMDAENSGLVIDWVKKYRENRILIYAGNKPEEFVHFERRLEM
ncbi:MAG: ATP-binding cassette domain-containing protein [Bacteroidota bacterium]